MLSKIFSVIALVVLGLVIAAAVLSYHRIATAPTGAEGAVPTGAPGLPGASGPGAPSLSDVPSPGGEPVSPGAAAQPGYPGSVAQDERRSLILELALTSLPGWDGKVVAYDDNWATATVRAVSPDRKVALEIRVSWDSELGDYEVVSATPVVAPQRAPARSSAIPEDIIEAIVSRPTFAALPNRKLIPKQITEKTAVLVVQGGAARWRVALQRRGEKWVITEVRKLQPSP